ncbi:MAG: hypothetical protein K0Q89_3117 [Thermomicrobiales bacterium]|nr:hypothetical protein [Thermomicrobiales bacterium]
MRRSHMAAVTLSLAPWFLAGSMLLGEAAPVSAQDASPVPVAISTATTDASAESPGLAAVPSAGVGSGLAGGGTGPLSLGALVGAGVATVFALRERLKNR